MAEIEKKFRKPAKGVTWWQKTHMPHRGGHLTRVQLLGSWLGEEGTKKLLPKHKADKSVAGNPLGQGHRAQEPPICLQCLVTELISLADGLQLNEISFCCAADSECSHLEDLELKIERNNRSNISQALRRWCFQTI